MVVIECIVKSGVAEWPILTFITDDRSARLVSCATKAL